MLQLTPYDWQYKTEPQDDACFGLTDKVVNIIERRERYKTCTLYFKFMKENTSLY